MLRIFTSVKIQRLWPGLNPGPWVPEVSMLTTRPPKPSPDVTRKFINIFAGTIQCAGKSVLSMPRNFSEITVVLIVIGVAKRCERFYK
jgi:hypothetical protein